MRKPPSDDWGTPLGADPDRPREQPRPKKDDTLKGLVYFFSDRLLLDTSNLMNSQINGPALSKAFRKILDTGRSYDDVRAMIVQFYKEIQSRPLKDGIPVWKAFIGRLDSLAQKVAVAETPTVYNGPKIDPRLMEGPNG